MRAKTELSDFERTVLPHLDAAFDLARWLTRDDADAQDVVQEACLRAFRYFDGFQGGDGKSWLLAIVRNSSYTWLAQHRAEDRTASLDEQLAGLQSEGPAPDAALVQGEDREAVRRAIEALPAEFREVIVLRELEGLSYKQIAAVADVPIGTVMSRLGRGRQRLLAALGRPDATTKRRIKT